MRFYVWLILSLFASSLWAQQNPNGQLPVATMPEPLVMLVRDELVLSELNVTASQRQQLARLAAACDPYIWKTRNQTPEKSADIMSSLTGRVEQKLATILKPEQQQRLDQIRLWIRGVKALSDDDIVQQLQMTEQQAADIKQLLTDTAEKLQAAQQQAQESGEFASAQAKVSELNASLQKELAAILDESQRRKWISLIGKPIDTSQLGKISFTAPELTGENEWIHSPPLSMRQLKGKVVALHFFAFG